MKVRMLGGMIEKDGTVYNRDDVVEFDDAEAKRLISVNGARALTADELAAIAEAEAAAEQAKADKAKADAAAAEAAKAAKK